MEKQKKYMLVIRKTNADGVFGTRRQYFFSVIETAKGYPLGFVCKLPVNPEVWPSATRLDRITLIQKDLSEFATELLVDAYYNYETDPEIRGEIVRRLCLIWKERR